METDFEKLQKAQQLVVNVIKVNRNHFIPGTDRHENVIEHSFSLLILCWKIFEIVKPPLQLEKIFKYALVHDFTERGLNTDTNTYAGKEEKKLKKEREAKELEKISAEFKDFEDMILCLKNYETMADGESLFVWSVDKMQGMILGSMDAWRPYANYGVIYKQFCDKGEEFIEKCSPFLKDVMKHVFEESCKTYYDNPSIKK